MIKINFKFAGIHHCYGVPRIHIVAEVFREILINDTSRKIDFFPEIRFYVDFDDEEQEVVLDFTKIKWQNLADFKKFCKEDLGIKFEKVSGTIADYITDEFKNTESELRKLVIDTLNEEIEGDGYHYVEPDDQHKMKQYLASLDILVKPLGEILYGPEELMWKL